MVEEVAKVIKKQFSSLNRVGVLATKGTVNAGQYRLLEKFGLKVLYPTEVVQEKVHQAIYHPDYGIKSVSGSITIKAKQGLEQAASSLIQKKVEIIERLGFSKCRVSIALPKEVKNMHLSYFEGKKIATSYPNILKTFLKKNNVNAEIHTISGSVEIAPNIGLADGICDIVSSGSTLFKNGLKESLVILTSEAVLAKSLRINAFKEEIMHRLLFRIQAVMRAKNTKYILMNVPDFKIAEVTRILPVLKSPTILPLAQKAWSSLHSVIDENKFWEVIDDLKNAGAEDILIIPIDKMVL